MKGKKKGPSKKGGLYNKNKGSWFGSDPEGSMTGIPGAPRKMPKGSPAPK